MNNRRTGRAASRRFLRSAPLILLASFFVFHALSAVQGPFPERPGERAVLLFTALGTERPGPDEAAPWAVRSRPVEINPLFFEERRLEAGTRIVVAPFEGPSFTAVLKRAGIDINGVLSFRAAIEGTEHGALLLSSADGCALGRVDIPEWDLRFEIAPDMRLGLHVVREVDPRAAQRAEREPAPPLVPGDGGQQPAAVPAVGPDDIPAAAAADVNVDLMIVYTPAAAAYASSVGGINLVISQALQLSQTALDNSDAGILLRLVYSSEINYQESGSSNTDLSRLTYTSDGYMDEVHAWRNLYGADMVNLLAEVDDFGGVAWLLTEPAGRPSHAFSLVRVRQASTGYTLVHELGHNFGCHHRKDQETQPGSGIFHYSAGWRWIGSNTVRYCSVMSYTDTWDGYGVTRVGHFSSPLISHMGASTGHATDGDNARTLRETKGVVSSYRVEVGGDPWLTIRVTEGGTTVPAPGSYAYPLGSVVQVTAQPYAHYLFSNWSGHASGAANPVSVTMDENKSITANFLRNIYAPVNAQGEKILNRSLSQAEYINILTWEANPDNEDIVNYRIYRIQGPQRTLLTYVESDVFTFQERRVERDKIYTYWVVAVNAEWREGDPAEVVVR